MACLLIEDAGEPALDSKGALAVRHHFRMESQTAVLPILRERFKQCKVRLDFDDVATLQIQRLRRRLRTKGQLAGKRGVSPAAAKALNRVVEPFEGRTQTQSCVDDCVVNQEEEDHPNLTDG